MTEDFLGTPKFFVFFEVMYNNFIIFVGFFYLTFCDFLWDITNKDYFYIKIFMVLNNNSYRLGFKNIPLLEITTPLSLSLFLR